MPKAKNVKKTKTTELWWDYMENVTPVEFIKRIAPMIMEPVEQLRDFEGDLLMSEYNKLTTAYVKLQHAVKTLNDTKNKKK